MITYRNLNGHAKFVILFAAALLIGGLWFAAHFIKAHNASADIPRLFLRLERAIGYDGFIHNFKNYVLRADGDRYLHRAQNNYREAQTALAAIATLGDQYGIDASLARVEETLNEYYDKLKLVQQLKSQGRSVAEIDTRVKVSDMPAGAAIRQFEQQVVALITKRNNQYFWGLLAHFALLSLTLLTLFLSQLWIRQTKQYNTGLQKSEQRLRQAESLAQLGRWKSNAKGALYCSKSTMRMFGITNGKTHVTQKYFWSHVHPEDRQKLKAAIRRATHGTGRYTCVHRLVRHDGRHLTICNSGAVKYDAKGNANGFTGTFQDITHIVDMEERLQQAEQMEVMGKLSGGLAHDFNNLLAIIQGNIQLALNTKLPEFTAENLNTAMLAISRGSDLTKSMLSYARKSPMRPTRLNLNKMVRENTSLSARLLPANIHLDHMLFADLWDIHTDANLVQSALFNLIMNAKDAMPDGGTLTIKTENLRIPESQSDHGTQSLEPGEYVVVSVSDTGMGIPHHVLPKIFDPFYTTKPIASASGLGLSMVVGFMEQAGGGVDVVTKPQSGTTFKLYFKATETRLDALPRFLKSHHAQEVQMPV